MTSQKFRQKLTLKPAWRPGAKAYGCIFLWSLLLVLVLGSLGAPLARAQDYQAGLQAFEEGDFDRAHIAWRPLAERGEAWPQFGLGTLFEHGGGAIAQDEVQAAIWYGRAAEQGLAVAQNNLARLYSEGRGVPQDKYQAARLWLLAAAQGHPTAAYNLALAYFAGDGAMRSSEQAAAWFYRAADQGLPDAQFALGQLYMHGAGVEQDQAIALTWFELAASLGVLEARQLADQITASGVDPAVPPQLDKPRALVALEESGMEVASDTQPQSLLPPGDSVGDSVGDTAGGSAGDTEGGPVADTSATPTAVTSETLQAPTQTPTQTPATTAAVDEALAPNPAAPSGALAQLPENPTTVDVREPGPVSRVPPLRLKPMLHPAVVPVPRPRPPVLAAMAPSPESLAAVDAARDAAEQEANPSPVSQVVLEQELAGANQVPEAEAEIPQAAAPVASEVPPTPVPEPVPESTPEPDVTAAPEPETETAPQVAAVAETPPDPAPDLALAPTPAPVTMAQGVVPIDQGTGHLVWLGSVSGHDDAEGLWMGLKSRNADLLGGLDHDVIVVDLGDSGTFYRVVAGAFDSEGGADALCDQLRNQEVGVFCKIIANAR